MREYGDVRYHPPGISEADLISAFAHVEEARPCACGGVIIAYPKMPADGVMRHQATEQHREWSIRVYTDSP
jgi:hypothetical protein